MNDKKIGVFFLLGVFLILGVYFVIADLSSASVVTKGPDSYFMANNTNQILNFTITIHNDPSRLITLINITIPGNNLTIKPTAGILFLGNGTSNIGNWTFVNETVISPHNNITSPINRTTFSWRNNSGPGWNASIHGTSINFWVNVTSYASSFSDNLNQSIEIYVNGTTSLVDGVYTTFLNNTNVSISIDSFIPRVTQINISDGNTTYINGTNLNATYRFGVDSPLVVRITVNETNLQNVWFYYNISGNVSVIRGGNSGTRVIMSTSDMSSPYVYNATIPASALGAASANNLTYFRIYINDTVDNWNIINDTSDRAFSVNLTPNILKIGALNATDSSGYVKSDSNLRAGGKFLGAGRLITFAVELTGEQKQDARDTVRLYYNHTREANTTDDFFTMRNMTNYTTGVSSITGTVIYNASLQPGIYNDTSKLRFLVLANDTFSYQTLTRFNFTIDGTAPTIGAPTSSSSSVSLNTAVTLTCATASDADNVLSYIVYLDTPASSGYEAHSGSSYTTGTDETNIAGTSNFYCTVTDSTGHSTTSATSSFTITSGGSTTSSSSGGGGGGGTTVTPTATEVTEISEGETENLGTLTQTISNNLIMEADSVASFNMVTSSSPSTTSSHSITINEITEASVTLTIESDPIEITLEIGDIETVDVDVDGTDDLEIILNDITDGQANLTVNTLVEAVTPTPTPTPTPTEGVTPPTAEAKPLTGLWIIVIIVVVGLVLWFLFRKKK